MSNEDLSDRFITACEEARGFLEHQDRTKYSGLGQAVRSSRNKVVVANRDLLIFLAELRNTIQHSGRLHGEAIATPRIDAVEAMEKLSAQIERPLPASNFMVRNPVTVTDSTPLPVVAHLIIDRSLSQLPVVDE